MSKKKSFSGSTMTLKDFHGGSIPTDLSLPSAPGVSARPPDRWAPSPIAGARPDAHHRQRPGSAGGGTGAGPHAGSGFDERGPPFLSTPANIGRHFDEDERKPFDDGAAAFPRRSAAPAPAPFSDPRPSPFVMRSDPRPQQVQPHPQPQHRSAVGPSPPNAWGLRREEPKPVPDLVPTVQTNSAATLSSRFAQASAIEKISSGRWQTRPMTPPAAPEVDVVRFQEAVAVMEEVRVSSPLQQEAKERGFFNDGTRPLSREGRFVGGPQLQQQHQQHYQQQPSLGMDGGERPKLKLLPRSKPLDADEARNMDVKQSYQPTVDPVRVETPQSPREHQNSMNMLRPGSAGADAGSRASERPKLNLKPRSLPVEQPGENLERERKSVFGGARPRELVLKERGIDDVATSPEVTSPANKAKSITPRTDLKQKMEAPAVANKRGERSDSFPAEQRSGRDFERKEVRSDHEKVDNQRASWRNDNWKNARETEKPAERRPEPETWRKPVEEPKPEVPETMPRPGKAASALELAHAFSRSVSDNRSDNRFPNQSLPGRVQVPFSRLTDTRDLYSGSSPRQINGY